MELWKWKTQASKQELQMQNHQKIEERILRVEDKIKIKKK